MDRKSTGNLDSDEVDEARVPTAVTLEEAAGDNSTGKLEYGTRDGGLSPKPWQR